MHTWHVSFDKECTCIYWQWIYLLVMYLIPKHSKNHINISKLLKIHACFNKYHRLTNFLVNKNVINRCWIIVWSISWSPLTLMVNLQHWPNVGQSLFSKLTLTNMWNHSSLHILRGKWVGYVKVLFISTSLHYYWLEYELDLTTDFAVYLSGLKKYLNI